MELGIPVVMAVNMMDIVEKNGDKIHTGKLAEKLGCEVVRISALKGTGIKEAGEKAVALVNRRKTLASVHTFAPEVEEAIASAAAKLGSGVPEEQKRFFAIKLLEKDEKIAGQIGQTPDVSAEIEMLENTFDDDTEKYYHK